MSLKDVLPFFMRLLVLFLLLFTFLYSNGQSMSTLFKWLPSSCTEELDDNQRDSLLKEGYYIIPGGDSMETVRYEIDTSFKKDYFSGGFGFTTGQRGGGNFELKRLYRKNGVPILIYSYYGGHPTQFNQWQIRIFNIYKNKLVEWEKCPLPLNISVSPFIKKGIADKVREELTQYSSMFYQLDSHKTNEIIFEVSNCLGDYDQYLLVNQLVFTWNGVGFVKHFRKAP